MLKVTSNFDPDRFKRKVMDVAKKKIDAKVASVGNLRCKVHHQVAQVRITGATNYEIAACCADFKNEVLTALKGQ